MQLSQEAEFAHILFIDVVGFGKIPNERQQSVLVELSEAVSLDGLFGYPPIAMS